MFEDLKEREIFSKIRYSNSFLVVRCDGRNFKKLSKILDLVPFDERFRRAFLGTVINFMKTSGFDTRLAFFASDEISYFIANIPYMGRIEKIDSIIASYTSSIFSLKIYETFKKAISVAFDSRIVDLRNLEDVTSYLIWRQNDAFRNFLNKMAQVIFLEKGYSPRSVCKILEGLKANELINIINKNKGDIKTFPNWQKYGDLVYLKPFQKKAIDKILGKEVTVKRHRITIESFNFLENIDKLNNIIKELLFQDQT